MLTLPPSVRIYVAPTPIDVRRGHDGLVSLVRDVWKMHPYDGHLFVFFGRRLDRVKVLFWDSNGFVIHYKRLSKGRFRLPELDASRTHVELSATTLAMVLDGVDVRGVKRVMRWSPPSSAKRSEPAA